LKSLPFLVGLPVILSLSSICTLALAGETNWLEVTQPSSNNRIFVDVNSIKRLAVTGDIKYKVRDIYNRPTSGGVYSRNSTYVASCDFSMQRLSEVTTYNRSNRIIQAITYGAQTRRGDFRNVDPPMEQVTSSSANYAAFKYICSR
jgi:hypothetical protein